MDGLSELPIEILHLITMKLDLLSFLNLTSTCKTLHGPELTHDSRYWSCLVRSTFRVPNKPTIQNNGRWWRNLYKRMSTQVRPYAWGNDDRGCLGRVMHSVSNLPVRPGRQAARYRHISWPTRMEQMDHIGILADLQCGGWSTTVLTAKGAVWAVGVIDGQNPLSNGSSDGSPRNLHYPRGLASPLDKYEPTTAIRQFSTGRSHVLAVADSGRIWSWNDVDHPGVHVDLGDSVSESSDASSHGYVQKVVAGWSKSAALVNDVGIVVWEKVEPVRGESGVNDAVKLADRMIVPGSYERRNHRNAFHLNGQSEEIRGEVCNFVMLEHSIIFITHLGKVFQSRFDTLIGDDPQLALPEEVALDELHAKTPDECFVTDVQGSFRNFALFTRSGAVLISSEAKLSTNDRFERIPALQKDDVISLAFGDYHFHALHTSGHITSYGKEPHKHGAFGLGSGDEGKLRGICNNGRRGISTDGFLVQSAYRGGRQVWFEPEKRAWLEFIASGGVDHEEARERMSLAFVNATEIYQEELSEWIEQEGKDWEAKFGISATGEDNTCAFFALGVAAAGWHSGALVLVDEERAQKITDAVNADIRGRSLAESTPVNQTGGIPFVSRFVSEQGVERQAATTMVSESVRHVWSTDHFPRLRLRDGTEMPGAIPFDDWRYGHAVMNEASQSS